MEEALMRHSILRDGLIAGALGATSVAVWFFFVDLIAGKALATPFTLGRGFLGLLGVTWTSEVLVVAIYTVFHYAAFIAVASIAAGIIHWGERVPSVLAGAFILFVIVELGFYLMTKILGESPTYSGLSAMQVSVGNLISAVVMGTYLWRTHPGLKKGLDYALSGRP
jgi:hypothetical protein